MSNTTDVVVIKTCLDAIEEKLNRGKVLNWSQYDFEKLSGEIEDKTGVVLSVTTLKRIWGKVKYHHSPTMTTLNTLAKFLDYDDWRAFVQSLDIQAPDEAEPVQPETKTSNTRRKFNLYTAIPYAIGAILFLFAISFLVFSTAKAPIQSTQRMSPDSSLFAFRADKVIGEGVPNSVVFTYDASAAPTDSVYIVQTWDISRKTLVSRKNNKHSAIYYYPGFFKTRLIIDSTVVKSHNLQISTNGWLCLVEQNPVPLYFRKEDCFNNGVIEVDEELLKKHNLQLQPNPPPLRFFNQRDLGNLMNDNFIFETKVRNTFDAGNNACQFMQVLIQCKDDIIIIPLGAKTCSGNFYLYAAGKGLSSKDSDLTGFGADLKQWTTLRVETTDRLMKFFVNGKAATSLVFPDDPTGIVGLQYRFNGVGAVKDTWFENANGKVMMN